MNEKDYQDAQKRRGEIAARLKELRAMSAAGTFGNDQQTEWDGLIDEVEKLGAEIAKFETRRKQERDVLGPLEALTEPNGQRAAGAIGNGSGNNDASGNANDARRVTAKRMARQIIESESFKEWRASHQKGVASVVIPQGFYFAQEYRESDDFEPIKIRAGSRLWDMETRGLVYTGSFPTGAVERDRVPGILQQSYLRPSVRDAFQSSPTTSNLIAYVRELLGSHTNAAAFVAEPTASGGSTGTKPESTLVFDGDEAAVREIATWIPIAENIADDLPGLESLIENRLLDFLAQAEDDALLNGDGVAPNLKGIYNTSGIQVADGTYFGANPVNDAGESNEDFNRLLAARELVRINGYGTADFAIISPVALQYMLTATNANREYYGGGPFVGGRVPLIWGMPVIESDKTDDDIALVGDGRMAEVRDRQQGQVDMGWINDQFIRDMQTLRAKERLAFPVYRPAAFVETELALN